MLTPSVVSVFRIKDSLVVCVDIRLGNGDALLTVSLRVHLAL